MNSEKTVSEITSEQLAKITADREVRVAEYIRELILKSEGLKRSVDAAQKSLDDNETLIATLQDLTVEEVIEKNRKENSGAYTVIGNALSMTSGSGLYYTGC